MVIKMIEVQACSPAPQQQTGRHHELHQMAVGGEVGEQQSNSGRIYKLLGQMVRYGGNGAQFSCFVLKDGDRMYRLDDH